MSNFGQLMSIIDFANQAQYMAAKAVIQSKKIKGEQRLAEEKARAEAQLKQLDKEFREKEFLARLSTEQRRDILFKEIALYAGLGIGAVAIILTLGVFFLSRGDKRPKFPYEMMKD